MVPWPGGPVTYTERQASTTERSRSEANRVSGASGSPLHDPPQAESRRTDEPLDEDPKL